MPSPTERLSVLLDDDPTGPQLLANVPMLLKWSQAEIAEAAQGHRSIHLMTNTRALDPRAAAELTRNAAYDAITAVPNVRLVLRGDSTLRAHLVEEYDAVRSVAFPSDQPALLLVPAMPSAGRVTRGGVHWLVRGGRAQPIAESQYAQDGDFRYRSSRLLNYAQERSGGRFPTSNGLEVPLARLLNDGPVAVADALESVAGRAGVVVPDAVTAEHVERIVAGLLLAEERGVPVIARGSPTLAAVLGGGAAEHPVPLPDGSGGILVVCGSYVASTTRQLAELHRRFDMPLVEIDVERLAAGQAAEELATTAQRAGAALTARGAVVLSTPRARPVTLQTLDAGRAIATGLARAAAAIVPRPAVVVTKGGVTSAVTVRDGFGVHRVNVRGPVANGISRWDAGPDRPHFVVFPGNTGDDCALADLVQALRHGVSPALG
jgi:uncharacterized protein YgbK (DUF1537 family)